MSFKIIQDGKRFNIYRGDSLFTVCDYSEDYIRPFMGPVYTSFGKSFTRFKPFHEEHPHQRSVFVGIGDINGVDFWNEKGEGKGKMVFDSLLTLTDGETAVLSVKLVWKSVEADEPLLDEIRTIAFSVKDDCVAVDFSTKLTASYTAVSVGKTKEAGPLGIRVADELRADKGGSFTNSDGGVNEEFCWGKEALWCNYSGTIDDKNVGICCFDKSTNERYPTTWHVRNYGLMAPNNLFFKGGYELRHGDTIEYNYLICFWEESFDPENYI